MAKNSVHVVRSLYTKSETRSFLLKHKPTQPWTVDSTCTFSSILSSMRKEIAQFLELKFIIWHLLFDCIYYSQKYEVRVQKYVKRTIWSIWGHSNVRVWLRLLPIFDKNDVCEKQVGRSFWKTRRFWNNSHDYGFLILQFTLDIIVSS